jgi:hypothetical protein
MDNKKILVGKFTAHTSNVGYEYYIQTKNGNYHKILFYEHGMEIVDVPLNKLIAITVYKDMVGNAYEACYDDDNIMLRVL